MSFGIMDGRKVKEVIGDIITRHEMTDPLPTVIGRMVVDINEQIEAYDMQVLVFMKDWVVVVECCGCS
jgi:hypothetical protein